MQALVISLLFIFMSTQSFGQQKKENHSIKIKYSSTIEGGEFSKICEIISLEYSKFDCSGDNPTMLRESEDEYLLISIDKGKKVRLVLKTTDPENVNIEKFRELEEKLDAY